jgi:hypothetical protein
MQMVLSSVIRLEQFSRTHFEACGMVAEKAASAAAVQRPNRPKNLSGQSHDFHTPYAGLESLLHPVLTRTSASEVINNAQLGKTPRTTEREITQ